MNVWVCEIMCGQLDFDSLIHSCFQFMLLNVFPPRNPIQNEWKIARVGERVRFGAHMRTQIFKYIQCYICSVLRYTCRIVMGYVLVSWAKINSLMCASISYCKAEKCSYIWAYEYKLKYFHICTCTYNYMYVLVYIIDHHDRIDHHGLFYINK